ncbi:MAG: sulfotransferase [Acidobacteria bacterium]|nr:sulfotransferase [Acidobacteriota bacterium]
MRLPEFIIGGAPRSGTTWLSALLDRHPAVQMAKPLAPEPKFFLVDSLYARGLEHYSRTWFHGIDEALVAGEKSTDYLESAAAAERIARDLPNVKLIFILREPVERAYSNYLWTRMNGLEHESFEAALALEAQRERDLPEGLRFARPYSYFSRGLYADLLQPYLDRFDRNQWLVVRFEDIVDRPQWLAARMHRFLGVAERPDDAISLGVINPSTKDGTALAPRVRASLQTRYQEPNGRLAALLGAAFDMWT